MTGKNLELKVRLSCGLKIVFAQTGYMVKNIQ